MFGSLFEKFQRREEENFAVAQVKGVFINPPNSTEWTQAIGKCVASFSKNKMGQYVIRILSDDDRNKSLYRFAIYQNFPYDVQSQTWHSWDHHGVFYGLDFASPEEAAKFAAAIKDKEPLAPPPEPKRPRKPDAVRQEGLKKAAQKHGLPDSPEAVAVYEQAGLDEKELEDEPTRILVQEELDNLTAALIMAEKDTTKLEPELKAYQTTGNVKPRPETSADDVEQLKAEVERLRGALEDSNQKLNACRRNLAREVARKRQFRETLIANKIPIPKPPRRPRKPRGVRNQIPDKKEKNATPPKVEPVVVPPPIPPKPDNLDEKYSVEEAAPAAPAVLPFSAAALQKATSRLKEVDDAPDDHPQNVRVRSGITADMLQGIKLTKRKHPERWNDAAGSDQPTVEMFGEQLSNRLWVRRMAKRLESDDNDAVSDDSWED